MFMKRAKYVTFRRTKFLHVYIAATAMHEKGNSGRFGRGSFRRASSRPGSFRPILGLVFSALVGGSFRPIFQVSRFGPRSFRPMSIETSKV